MNGCATVKGFDPKSAKETLNRWIAHETAKAAAEITEAIEAYRFNDAAAAIYRFVWNIYCDWYLELAKPLLTGPEGAAKSETQAMVAWARDEILKLLQPFMPFITEELWAVTGKHDALLALGEWPQHRGLANEKSGSRDWLGDRSSRPFVRYAPKWHHRRYSAGARGASAESKAPSGGPNSSSALRAYRNFVCGRAASGSVQLVVRGGGGSFAAQGRDRSRRRARPPRQGNC
jgi:hypothetical protein